MDSKPPFLTLDQQIEYLYKKYYFDRGTFDDTDRNRLGSINFHYFLGYARNFRELHFKRKITGPKDPSRVFRLIDIDAQVSGHLYIGIRNAEWLLRHYLVREYCQKYDPRGTYLDHSNYLELGSEYANDYLARGLMSDILEYGEDYVVSQLKESSKKNRIAVPRRCTEANWEDCRKLTRELPLWAVVDSFSLGRLVKLIQRCDGDSDPQSHLWRDIAKDFEIKPKTFQSGMDSLRSLRNLISHHSRLWSRPTTNTPRKQGIFRSKMESCHDKSMLPAFYNVASFQGLVVNRRQFATDLEAIINSNEDYYLGVSQFGEDL